ncbi:MAG: hypothetical protein EZS28_048979, partial [Streblomastix strix]
MMETESTIVLDSVIVIIIWVQHQEEEDYNIDDYYDVYYYEELGISNNYYLQFIAINQEKGKTQVIIKIKLMKIVIIITLRYAPKATIGNNFDNQLSYQFVDNNNYEE